MEFLSTAPRWNFMEFQQFLDSSAWPALGTARRRETGRRETGPTVRSDPGNPCGIKVRGDPFPTPRAVPGTVNKNGKNASGVSLSAGVRHEVIRDACLTIGHLVELHVPEYVEQDKVKVVYDPPDQKLLDKAHKEGTLAIPVFR